MPKERVLVVDDESAVRDVVCAVLDHGGYEVTAVASAEHALDRLARDADYDLVLSDIMMPGTDGLCLLDRITADFPGTPVVLITAVHDVHIATGAFRRGAADFLLKPFERNHLLHIVVRSIERQQTIKRNALYRQNLESMVAARTQRLRSIMVDLDKSYDTTLEAMGDALDLRDEETEGHSRRVTAYSIELARAVGLSADDLRLIARGAFLHDIGKIATPDRILLKPGKLDDQEMAIMRRHCAQGYEIVRKIPFLRDAAEIVYAHQERFDGKGYPRGLKGEEIPLGARVFALADTMDAITSDRPYRKATSFETAQSEIARGAGGQFDPRIVEVYLRIPVSTWRALRCETTKLTPAALSAKLWHPAVA